MCFKNSSLLIRKSLAGTLISVRTASAGCIVCVNLTKSLNSIATSSFPLRHLYNRSLLRALSCALSLLFSARADNLFAYSPFLLIAINPLRRQRGQRICFVSRLCQPNVCNAFGSLRLVMGSVVLVVVISLISSILLSFD